ncbi:MAG: hypothetical protein OJF59_002374 [Cytophagales bacterium]|jgi:hypothetical protein|nr:hypothetical protein [Bacteroidota bacterium]MBS1980113.1 hypothetical protein [Bacteroidota bacterium]WHZ08620.1 MAG: hypothetical protein OJF59_002374 [Cytophagales bacterium]
MNQSKKNLLILFLVIYLLLLVWLSSAWHGRFISFHFFDDLFEWEYLDKLGHFFASFHLGLYFYRVFGNPEDLNSSAHKKWMCFSGFMLLLPIEILDGFAENYGASPADLCANGLGSLLCYLHVSYKISAALAPKFSFHQTAYSLIRPDLLGSTFAQQIIKDYNGQTYWASVDINKLTGKKIFPGWLVISVGYGAEGLLGGHDNVWPDASGKVVDYSHTARTKRIFISVDILAHELMRKNNIFNYLFRPFVILKFPAPALEFNVERGIVFHLIYF